MDISEIAFLVDGPTEDSSLKAWINKYYHKIPNIRRTPGNGIGFTQETYAKKVAPTIVQNLNSKIHAIIIIPDFEGRGNKTDMKISDFAEELKVKIIKEVCGTALFKEDDLKERIFVCPSDIMFENWIISDIEGIKTCNGVTIDGECGYYDGKNGSSLLKKMIKNKRYIKTADAPKLFKKVRKKIGPEYSPSFNVFISTLDKLCMS